MTITRTAALVLVLAGSGLVGTAFADDEYGTSHETVIRQAAASSVGKERDRVASTAPIPSIRSDLVGAGGPQDALARLIYHPGSGTDW